MSSPFDILFVEDNAAEADLAMRILSKQILREKILRVKDGEEALAFFFNRNQGDWVGGALPVKLILLDLKMPKVSGIEVLRALKSNERMALIPVVVFTSSQEPRDIFESSRLGANSYIVKPMDYQKFSEVLASVVQYWLNINTCAPFLPKEKSVNI